MGRNIAEQLSIRGVTIIASGRQQVDVDETVSAIRDAGGNALGFPANLKSPAAAHQLANRALQAVGKLDILVNNAGMSLRANFWEVTDAEWDEQVNVNLRSPFILAQHAARNMIERKTSGRIVNIGTIGARKCHNHGASMTAPRAGSR